jgi:MYXO-CTERM domain-containing protein
MRYSESFDWTRNAILGALLWAGPALAELPEYTFQLQARTNLAGNRSGAYNLEPGNLLAGSYTLPITKDRRVGFTLAITPEGSRGLWYGVNGEGRRIYTLPRLGEDARMDDPSIDSRGNVVFAVTGADTNANNGIYLLNVDDPEQVSVIREPLGSSSWSSLVLNEAGQLGARTYVGTGYAYALYTPRDGRHEVKLLATDQRLDATSPYTFLYSPNLNDLGQLVAAVDLASASTEWFQELRVWSADGTSRLIMESRGRNPASPIYRFASVQPALNNRGQVAFLASVRNESNQQSTALFLWDGAGLKKLAQDGLGDIKQLGFFPPDLNDQGLVVFRAFRANGLRAVWVSDGESLEPVVTEHDVLPSDLGPARVDQETPSNPVFGGSPMINSRGDITFCAGLAPPEDDQEEWGSAIYVARSSFEPPQDGDGGVDPDAGTEPDGGGEVDGGTGADAGTDQDGGSDGQDAGTGNPAPVDPELPAGGGCGCQAAASAALWPWALVGLLRLARLRRGRHPDGSRRD